jgi:hypothetical protein
MPAAEKKRQRGPCAFVHPRGACPAYTTTKLASWSNPPETTVSFPFFPSALHLIKRNAPIHAGPKAPDVELGRIRGRGLIVKPSTGEQRVDQQGDREFVKAPCCLRLGSPGLAMTR